jgi:3-oxoacyl-[acyl-carrier protein] reductase
MPAQILAGQLALVTGASRGIGYAIAERLLELGASLAICARREEELERAAAQLREKIPNPGPSPAARTSAPGARVVAIAADLAQSAEIERLARQTEEQLGSLDILVNNAGVGGFGAFYQLTESDWDATVDTNLKAVFLLSRAVAPAMVARRRGYIINIASLAGKNAFAGGGIYCASKWGLLGLTGCMAEDLRAYGIRVSAICPGSVATKFGPHTGKSEAKMLQPADIALAVEMLLRQAPQSFISEIDLRPTQKP